MFDCSCFEMAALSRCTGHESILLPVTFTPFRLSAVAAEFWRSRLSKGKTRHRRRDSDPDSPQRCGCMLIGRAPPCCGTALLAVCDRVESAQKSDHLHGGLHRASQDGDDREFNYPPPAPENSTHVYFKVRECFLACGMCVQLISVVGAPPAAATRSGTDICLCLQDIILPASDEVRCCKWPHLTTAEKRAVLPCALRNHLHRGLS